MGFRWWGLGSRAKPRAAGGWGVEGTALPPLKTQLESGGETLHTGLLQKGFVLECPVRNPQNVIPNAIQDPQNARVPVSVPYQPMRKIPSQLQMGRIPCHHPVQPANE